MNTLTPTLPDWLCRELRNCPRAGGGVHAWLFKMARQLHAHHPAPEIVAMLTTGVAQCGRHVPQREIVSAVQNALACAWTPRNGVGSWTAPHPARKWPGVNTEQREAIIRDGAKLADLWEVSPVRLEDSDQHTETIIDRLFPGNPLLCCGSSKSVFATEPREDWRGHLASQQLIVPSPMCAPKGLTKDGKESAHTLSNTGPRRFLVCEFDQGTTDEHAAILLHLAAYAPLVMAVHSGNKSLHGWFYVAGSLEEKQHKFMRFAVSLGADPATWIRSQFVRIPDGTRDNGNRQTVFFFNPGLILANE